MSSIKKIPGVYINETENTSLTTAQEQLRNVAVVGLATSYKMESYTVQHVANSTDTVGVDDPTLVISCESIYIGETVVPAASYSYANGVVTWIDTVKLSSTFSYKIKLKLSKTSDDYSPQTWYNTTSSYNSIYELYGYPVVDGAINQVSAASKLALDAGAPVVVTVQTANASVSAIEAAIDKLVGQDVYTIVCPGITSSTLQTYLQHHVDTQSSADEMSERCGCVAPVTGDASVATISAQSSGLADQRVWNIAPGTVNLTLSNGPAGAVGTTDYSLTVSSIYAYASLAGRLCDPTESISKPITREAVLGIDSVDTKYSKYEREVLAGAGTLVLYTDTAGTVRVNQALTTDQSNANNSEISVVIIKDMVRKTLRESLDATFIGQSLNTKTSPADVRAAVTTVLTALIGNGISAFQNVVATVNASDPTAMDVSCEISVVRPFNYINLSFTVTV